MIVRVHKVGSSFKGCAAYLLHDKDASSAERVGWVAMHNLGTDNPQGETLAKFPDDRILG